MLTISRVKDIIGITEQELVRLNNRSKFIKNNHFYNIKTHELTPIGNFSTPSIQELCNSTLLHGTGPVICFNNKVINNNNPVNVRVEEFIDIADLQGQLKTADKAMVQVASNFNCLETPNRYITPDNGALIECLYRDCTQGPAATCGPLAASLYRCHFVFEGKGQNHKTQINLLSDVYKYFSVPINGKITLNGSERIIPKIEQVYDKIRIGLHADCAVLYSRNRTFDPPYNLIDQVFSSSLNINDYGKHSTNFNQKHMCRTLLRSAYEGIYLSAILRKRKQLYLTLIGGGSFNNDIDIIVQEIKRAHNKYAQYSLLEKVVICEYNTNAKLVKMFN